MAGKVTVKIENESAARHGFSTGDTVEVDPALAKSLIRNGAASPAKVADAKAAGVPVDTAATKK